MTLQKLMSRDEIGKRLAEIFPKGTQNRGYCTRKTAACVVFVALYVDAVKGSGAAIGPMDVYRMSDPRAARQDPESRSSYQKEIRSGKYEVEGKQWYADTSREQIRDESIREGLIPIGAMHSDSDVATTSKESRYTLDEEFAALFDPGLVGDALEGAIAKFRENKLSKGALARIAILRAGAAVSKAGTVITFPNKETRQLAAGPSTPIAKAVVEEFAPRFLENPAVIWLSESGNKVVMRDDLLAVKLGLSIQQDKNLPDLILVDVGPADPLVFFVEIVATDGAVSPLRKAALLKIAEDAGFKKDQVIFVTAYADSQSAGFKKTVSNLAWDTVAWFASEPENLVVFRESIAGVRSVRSLLSG